MDTDDILDIGIHIRNTALNVQRFMIAADFIYSQDGNARSLQKVSGKDYISKRAEQFGLTWRAPSVSRDTIYSGPTVWGGTFLAGIKTEEVENGKALKWNRSIYELKHIDSFGNDALNDEPINGSETDKYTQPTTSLPMVAMTSYASSGGVITVYDKLLNPMLSYRPNQNASSSVSTILKSKSSPPDNNKGLTSVSFKNYLPTQLCGIDCSTFATWVLRESGIIKPYGIPNCGEILKSWAKEIGFDDKTSTKKAILVDKSPYTFQLVATNDEAIINWAKENSWSQDYKNKAAKVKRGFLEEDLSPGDIIVYRSRGRAGAHVAIYVGTDTQLYEEGLYQDVPQGKHKLVEMGSTSAREWWARKEWKPYGEGNLTDSSITGIYPHYRNVIDPLYITSGKFKDIGGGYQQSLIDKAAGKSTGWETIIRVVEQSIYDFGAKMSGYGASEEDDEPYSELVVTNVAINWENVSTEYKTMYYIGQLSLGSIFEKQVNEESTSAADDGVTSIEYERGNDWPTDNWYSANYVRDYIESYFPEGDVPYVPFEIDIVKSERCGYIVTVGETVSYEGIEYGDICFETEEQEDVMGLDRVWELVTETFKDENDFVTLYSSGDTKPYHIVPYASKSWDEILLSQEEETNEKKRKEVQYEEILKKNIPLFDENNDTHYCLLSLTDACTFNNGDVQSLCNGTEWTSHMPSLKNGKQMFQKSSLTSFSGKMNSLTDANLMFSNSESLVSFTGTAKNLQDGSEMFAACTSLTTFFPADWTDTFEDDGKPHTLGNLEQAGAMFKNCKLSIKSIKGIAHYIKDVSGSSSPHWLMLSVYLTTEGHSDFQPSIDKIKQKGWNVQLWRGRYAVNL